MAMTAIRISPADHGRLMTLDEFREAEEEEGYRYELARGVLEVTEVPNEPHGLVVCELYESIGIYRRANPGRIFRYGGGSEYRLWLPGMISGRNPDIAVSLLETVLDPRGRRPPSLVMEVVSPGPEARTRDYITKRQEYLAFGLLEYRIIDPEVVRITILIRDGDAWIERAFHAGQVAEGLVLPGFRVDVAELLAPPAIADGDPDA